MKYLTITFKTDEGNASIYVRQREANDVMTLAQKGSRPGGSKEDSKEEPETEEVTLVGDRTTKIAERMPESRKAKLVNPLQINKDLFAYSPSDMFGIDPKLIQHSLHVDLNARPIKQKRRNNAPFKRTFIKEQVSKLLAA